ncbi:concanavalin A-like lectin/glucanase domain-containing protein [Crucibulum laeve]|uniref:Concanavalin A-like lectin/glucanase domain-containing protein n=1 Tax=Crucibulum laeve TaxID=68775 RepID=A0A5C3M917_9AGAR|nr:concanavalin A-like lectin/glucanase domain-containing protein [Crucibulum laeve]
MLQTDPSTIIVPARRVDPLAYTAAVSPPSDSDDESNASPPPPESIPTHAAIIAPENRVFKLPTRWSEQERNSMLSVSPDGRDLSYNGNGDKDAAAARATHSIPPACGIYYYEVDILTKETKTHISIGFAGRSAKYSTRVGHDTNSWGYHGNDGYVSAGDKTGMPYSQPFGVGDIVGCGIDFTTHKMFFTRNGTYLGPVFENVGKDTELYPSVSLQHHSETIRVNFGQEPFKFDIDYHVQRQRNDTWNKIMGTPLDTPLLEGRIPSKDEKSTLSEEEVKAVTSKLVLSYLVHHGYAKTARAFEKQRSDLGQENVSNDDHADVDMENPISAEKTDLDGIESDIARRTGIVKSVIAGDVDSALSETQTHYPSVLEAEEGLVLFKLRCRKFIELILETNEIKKRMRAITEPSIPVKERPSDSMNGGDWMDEDGMDVDDDSTIMSPSSSNAFGTNGVETAVSPYGGDHRRNIARDGWVDDTTSQYEAALKEAIVYGQTLQKEYEEDSRPEVQQMCKETFGIVAWKDPLKEGGPVVDIAGHTARVSLANELNQAILKSQGRPTLPALETLYRHTSTCVLELGMLGVGAAAFADMTKEFLEV